MFDSLLKKLFGDKNVKATKDLWPIVDQINQETEKLQSLSDDELRAKTAEFKQRIAEAIHDIKTPLDELKTKLASVQSAEEKHALHDEIEGYEDQLTDRYEEVLTEILPEAFAVVKDTCRRLVGKSWEVAGTKTIWEMVPYDVQLIGGMVLHSGKIAEMATGEGKTLVATLPVYLNALTGRGVHLVTVNDYLAKRDSEWMGEVYKFHGLTIGCIINTMDPEERIKQYNCDITYGTNNEFGFDYLRDNMASAKEYCVQRGHNFAIVDEVDSVLIDEARTPLIISGPVDKAEHKFDEMKPRVERLFRKQANLVASIVKEAETLLQSSDPKDREKAGVCLLRAHRGFPKNKSLMKLLSEAEYKKLLQTTELDFLRENSKRMPEIDEELYYAIEERQNQIDLTEKGREELAVGSKEGKQFFVIPDLGLEISKIENDAAMAVEERIKKKDELYHLYSERSDVIHTINQLLKAYTLFEKDDEYVITEEGKIAIVDEFTGRVLPGRRYSDGLHQAIEAKENVHVERDTQTLATITLQNYFRLYRKLAGMTGTAETEEGEFFEIYKLEVVVIPTNRPITRSDEDDAIYKTKREKYNAIIEKIKELKEQRRPVLVGTTSVDVSETISRMLKRQGVQHNVLNAKQHQREAEVVAFAGQPGAVTIATNMAGRGTDIKLGAGVKDSGGLYILGTERHEARRIDRQLRGRSGRQGDPGTTKFYISLEDDLMRLFGSDRITNVMSKVGMEEGEAIEHSLITKSVERAQKKVEENNFAIRKRLLEYDNVMNQQREVIYSRRKQALEGERLKAEVLEYLDEYIEGVVEKHYENAEMDQLRETILQHLLVDLKFEPAVWESLGQNGVKEKLVEVATDFYSRKEEMLGSELMSRLEQYAVLSVIDNKWREHLREMDDLKEGIGLRAYGQKDPLLEYKGEAYNLFVNLLGDLRNEVVSFCFKFWPQAPAEVQNRRTTPAARMKTIKDSADNLGLRNQPAEGSQAGKAKPIRVEEKTGRNEPCPCGSGKKFKNCHGLTA
ncbi:MAG: preprotein translocase subunit SecA [Stygiobacter sp. RIFOXYC12_FULL_38_8]|nr:MAG: preprotein translocase subunit SecA [Stygiobacter sp. GWC2_38_9]OGV07418.1 MAG: preprotein translocase subunit SecA [Stygiobacter sp. RIFOXYB2_FULL_37_11]OGV13676.1 MAG: preprotein translocase subunit SecA [Stygiobacter sp. RIFOXYC2_FULL_38_25]OGV16684.1 MAG: preprotein translocase subunit SecA [Stygiobacter sp. RIFOXYA2_FULL_38_8]OGV25390.1 MAG: preprotein translocase subunit SecA [Stygiobacter sp. RIFOXYC12_FULL_38_8]OGV80060.1 MAG: preprotein translocase subunit SecA [Stygiobacter s